MRLTRSRALALGGLAAGAAAFVFAVGSALDTHKTGGVAAAQATRLQKVTHGVRVGRARGTVTTRPSGAVCYRVARLSSCAPSLTGGQFSYATKKIAGRTVLAGVAGPDVRAV